MIAPLGEGTLAIAIAVIVAGILAAIGITTGGGIATDDHHPEKNEGMTGAGTEGMTGAEGDEATRQQRARRSSPG